MPNSVIAVFVALAVAVTIGSIVAWLAVRPTEPIPDKSSDLSDQVQLALNWMEEVEERTRSARQELQAKAGR